MTVYLVILGIVSYIVIGLFMAGLIFGLEQRGNPLGAGELDQGFAVVVAALWPIGIPILLAAIIIMWICGGLSKLWPYIEPVYALGFRLAYRINNHKEN